MSDARSGSLDRRASTVAREPLPAAVQLTPLQRIAATGGIAFIVLLLGLLIFDGITIARKSRDDVALTHRFIQAALGTLQDVTNAETGQRGYLLTLNDRYLTPYRNAHQALAADTGTMRHLAVGDTIENRELDSLSVQIDVKLRELARTIDFASTHDVQAAHALVITDVGQSAMENIRALVDRLSARENTRLAARTAIADAYYQRVRITVIAGTVIAVILALLLNTFLTRYATAQVAAARRLDAQNVELFDANRILGDQAVELELQNTQLQDQAIELESQQAHLQDQAAELEMQSEELRSSLDDVQHQRELADDARDKAEEANRAKSLFLTTMSHELRTPLNAIGGYVDLLTMEIRGPLVDTQREDLRRIKKSGQHLLSLINDILNLAKIESGQLDLHIRNVSLPTVLENVDVLVTPQFDAKGIAYTYPRCDPSLMVRADSEKLQQILLNLLSNACKFTNAGGRVVVECDARAMGGGGEPMIAIIVRDTGRGIEADKLEKIFEPFVQIDRHLTGVSQQGLGLGLAISRDLARSMSGDITAESEFGVGTTFTLTLPAGSAVSSSSTVADGLRERPDSVSA